MRFRSALGSRRRALIAILAVAAVAVALAVVLSLVLREGEVPAPADGIGDIPAAHLVPEDAALYVALGTDLDSDAWRAAFALLERLGFDDPLGRIREGIADEDAADWDGEIAPFLGNAAVLFLSGDRDADGDGGRGGAVIFHASDARAAEAVILRRRDDGFAERDYRDVPYKVMERGGALAVLGEHFVYAADEATVRAVIDARVGATRPLADSGDFRRLRNDLEGDALAFVYLRPAALLADSLGAPADGDAREAGPDLLALLGLDDLLAEPIGLVVRADGDAFRLEAVMLGDPKPIASILRPRESRFAAMVPAGTAVFVSVYDLAGLVDGLFGSGGIQQRLRGAVLDSAGEGSELGDLARLEDALALLGGETALAIWLSDDGATGEFVLLAEVDDEERAREAFGALFAEALAAGDAALSVKDGVAAFGTSAAAIEAVRGDGGPALADTARYAGAVARLDAPLAAFAYVDVLGLFASGVDEFAGLDLDGDALGLIVNLAWEDGRVRVEGALTVAPAD